MRGASAVASSIVLCLAVPILVVLLRPNPREASGGVSLLSIDNTLRGLDQGDSAWRGERRDDSSDGGKQKMIQDIGRLEADLGRIWQQPRAHASNREQENERRISNRNSMKEEQVTSNRPHRQDALDRLFERFLSEHRHTATHIARDQHQEEKEGDDKHSERSDGPLADIGGNNDDNDGDSRLEAVHKHAMSKRQAELARQALDLEFERKQHDLLLEWKREKESLMHKFSDDASSRGKSDGQRGSREARGGLDEQTDQQDTPNNENQQLSVYPYSKSLRMAYEHTGEAGSDRAVVGPAGEKDEERRHQSGHARGEAQEEEGRTHARKQVLTWPPRAGTHSLPQGAYKDKTIYDGDYNWPSLAQIERGDEWHNSGDCGMFGGNC